MALDLFASLADDERLHPDFIQVRDSSMMHPPEQ